MKILISGGSGFIGSELVKRLIDEHYEVLLLSRNPGNVKLPQHPLLKILEWDGKTLGKWSDSVNEIDVIVNLAGENVSSKRWSKKQKVKLRESRIGPTNLLIKAITNAARKPKILINASAVGYYGSFGVGDVTEDYPKGDGFLADLCNEWEQKALEAETMGVRVVILRLGVVLESSGGAMKKLLLPFKFYLGGTIGSGKQWFPWIHRDDVINVILFTLRNNSLRGPINVVSPTPVTMKEFAYSIGKALNKPSWMPIPSLILKLIFGEMSEVLIGGRRIIPMKLLDSGFKFQYGNLKEALNDIIMKNE